jgi:mycothiol synthase
MHHVDVRRRMPEEDIAAIATLLRAAETFDGHAPLGEHKWLDLVQGGRSGFAGFLAREPGHERVIGYAQLSHGPTSWGVECVVHPSFRDLDEPIEAELLRVALDEIARSGGGHVHLWVPKPTETNDRVASSLGLIKGRDLYQMRRLLPLEEQVTKNAHLDVRAFDVGKDEDAWLSLNNAAFQDHPEQGAWTLETLRDRMAQPWFCPSGFLLHEVDGNLASFCWTKIHDDEPPLGEIYVIGVDPRLSGHGLGRATLIAGLSYLSDRHIPEVMLYVDADNAPALSLYRALSFTLNHADRAYVGDIAATS